MYDYIKPMDTDMDMFIVYLKLQYLIIHISF